MLNKTAFLVLLVPLITLPVHAKAHQCGAGAEHSASQTASVFLRIDKNSYQMADNIIIDAGIINNGNNPVFVYNWISWGYGGGFVIRIKDLDGSPVPPVLRDDTMLPPPSRNDDANILTMLRDSGDFFGTRREMKVSDLVSRPGKYKLQIEYRSPLSCRYVSSALQKLPALWREDASIFSTEVLLNVLNQ